MHYRHKLVSRCKAADNSVDGIYVDNLQVIDAYTALMGTFLAKTSSVKIMDLGVVDKYLKTLI